MTQSQDMPHGERDLLRVTLQSIGDAVITTDTSGAVTFLNPVAEAITGWRLKDAIGVPLEVVFNIINEETRETVECPALRAQREGVVVGLANHTLLISRDGSERPIDDSAAPIRDSDGSVSGAVLVFRDVSERRQQEILLRQSEERFRLLVEGVKDYAIFMLDPSGIVTTWNAGAHQIKGYEANEIIGRHFSCFYPPEANAIGFPQRELDVAKVVGRFEDEGWRLRKDGSRFWANVVITTLRDEKGELRGFAKVTRDLTERRAAEEALRESQVLADLNRRKDEFLAMLSHELRNPLAPISAAVGLLRRQEIDAEARSQAITVLARQVGHLTRLVEDLLEVSRISTGRIRLKAERLDVRVVAERAIEVVQPLLAERNHRLSRSMAADAVWVEADPTRMEQVVVNLLTNAAKYTNDGGEIRLTIARDGEEAVLKVSDTGLGIEPELLPSIFELFTQSERSLDRSQGGLGIGLTIVERVVKMHGGTVTAESAGLGQGSEFTVRLPLAEPPRPQAQPPAIATVEDKQRKLRILVVDDNKDAADILGLMLRRKGRDVRVVYSSESALAAASEFQPDIGLLDIGLPHMDGYELARSLRSSGQQNGLRLIAVTGYGADSDQQRSLESGFDAHMVKPVDGPTLEQYLHRVVEASAAVCSDEQGC